MRLLLDTHVAIWAVVGDRQLAPTAAALISDPGNDVVVSMASLMAIAIKNATGRSNIGLTATQAAAEFEAAGLEQIPIALSHLSELEALPMLHGDPFDRLLVATARAGGYRLVTHDQALSAYGDHVLLV